MADPITVAPKGLTDYEGELDVIADAIRRAQPDAVVEVEDPKRMEKGRYGVVWGEVLSIGIPAGYVFGKVADAVVGAVIAGWKKKRSEGPANRPRIIHLYGPDGKILREVRVEAKTMLDEDGNERDWPDPPETPDDA